jgi:hypothetical protein
MRTQSCFRQLDQMANLRKETASHDAKKGKNGRGPKLGENARNREKEIIRERLVARYPLLDILTNL